jgi:hypothetical protein
MADLGGGLFAVPPEVSARRLDHWLAHGDPTDPLMLTALPAYLMDAIASAGWLEYGRCVDDCMILAHAYAQLGIDAQVRAAELQVTVRDTGATAAYGSRDPWWEDGMVHGHSIVWLPGPGHLIDTTIEQFAEIAAGSGPVIIPGTPAPAADGTPGAADEPFRVSLRRDDVLIAYSVAPPAVARRMLDHPVVADGAPGYRRRGMNIASETLLLLAGSLSPGQTRLIPFQRAAALTEAIRDIPAGQIDSGDWRFTLSGPNGTPIPTRIDRLPVPDGTPQIASISPDMTRSGL